MKTPENLKGTIRKFAKNKNLRPQEVLQMYLFERIIQRLSLSKYRDNFVLKGGLLIASMIGVEGRSTLDLDTTVRNITMTEDVIRLAIEDIIQVDVGDGICFMYEKMEPIRENDREKNFRVKLRARYGKIDAPMKIDITTGDVITPSAIDFSFNLLFENRSICVMAYNLETILAEKYETIITRNIGTTRARDFYDLYILFRSRFLEINQNDFLCAVRNTARNRGTMEILLDWKEICEDISKEEPLKNLWINYQNEYQYATGISFEDVVDNLLAIAQFLNLNETT